LKKPVLVTGASGKLGAYVVRALVKVGRPVVAWSGSRRGRLDGVELCPVDLAEPSQVKQAFAAADPYAVIHCAALSAVGDCYRDPVRARLVNTDGTALLGELADRIVYTSTDLVFSGEGAPYTESHVPAPLSLYGRSKRAGEEALLQREGAAVVRVALMYGPSLIGSGGFFEQQSEAFLKGAKVKLFHDEWRTPLALDEAAGGLLQVLDAGFEGVLHLAGPERLSREEMGRRWARFLGADPSLVESVSQSDLEFPEPRPADVSLDCTEASRVFGWSPKPFKSGLARMSKEK